MHPLGDKIQSFDVSSKALWPLCLLPAFATAPMVTRKLAVDGDVPPVAMVQIFLLVPASILLMYLLLRLLLSFFSVNVHELGIEGYDAYGRRVRAAWAHVQSVRPISLAGLGYLRVGTTGGGRTLWLPRFLSDQDAFARLVAERAGEDHPLTRGLSAP